MKPDLTQIGLDYAKLKSHGFNAAYGTLSRGSLDSNYFRKWKPPFVLGDYLLGILVDQQKDAEVIAGILKPVMDFQLHRPRLSQKKDALFDEAFDLHTIWFFQWLTQGITDSVLLRRATKAHVGFVQLQYGSRIKKTDNYGFSLNSALLFIGGEHDLLRDLYKSSVSDPEALEIGKARSEWQHTMLAIRAHVYQTLSQDTVLANIGRFLDSQVKAWFDHGHYTTVLHWLYIYYVILQKQTDVPPLDVLRIAWLHLGVAETKSKKKAPGTLQ